MTSIKIYIKNILFAFLTVSIFFLILELLSRILCFSCPELNNGYAAQNNIYEYDLQKIYRLKRNVRGTVAGKSVTTNSFGYRDAEHVIRKKINAVRILALGDSITFGQGVNSQETYPKQLEQIMRRNLDDPVDVINTAVPGYSTFQEYFDLERGLIFRPDVVTIQFTINDVVTRHAIWNPTPEGGRNFHLTEVIRFDHWFKNHSKFYFLLREFLIHIRFNTWDRRQIAQRARQQQAARERQSDISISTKEAWRICLKWMGKITDLCRKNNVDCILIIAPHEGQMFDLSKTFGRQTLKEFAAHRGIQCLDVLPLVQEKARIQILKEYSLREELQYEDLVANYSNDIKKIWRKYFLDRDHMTPQGHELVAKALYPFVRNSLAKRNPT